MRLVFKSLVHVVGAEEPLLIEEARCPIHAPSPLSPQKEISVTLQIYLNACEEPSEGFLGSLFPTSHPQPISCKKL